MNCDFIDSLLVVLVLYKQHITDSVSFISLQNSLNSMGVDGLDIVVYDNSPESHVVNEGRYSNLNVTYIHNKNNPGVSFAYNIAASIAMQRRKRYLLLLDQDTFLPKNFLSELAIPLSLSFKIVVPFLLSKDKIISPCNYIAGRGHFLSYKHQIVGIQSLKHRSFLNSGIVVSVDLFKEVGGYDERLPLYFSDFNFVNRVRKRINCYYQLPVHCIHEMSSNNIEDPQFVTRYKNYCEGALACYSSFGGQLMMALNVLSRSLLLFLKVKNFAFLKIAIASIMKNRRRLGCSEEI